MAADPKFYKPYLPLAMIELTERDWEEAIRLSSEALKLDSVLAEAHYYQTLAHHSMGALEQASASAQAVRGHGGTERFPRVCIILAECYGQQGKIVEAAEEFRRYVELEPDSPMAEQVRQRLAQLEEAGAIKKEN